jgi:hypothetical protein
MSGDSRRPETSDFHIVEKKKKITGKILNIYSHAGPRRVLRTFGPAAAYRKSLNVIHWWAVSGRRGDQPPPTFQLKGRTSHSAQKLLWV